MGKQAMGKIALLNLLLRDAEKDFYLSSQWVCLDKSDSGHYLDK